MQKIKFRIWSRKLKKFIEDSSSLHCQSNFHIGAFDGKVRDFVSGITDDGQVYICQDNDYYMDGLTVVRSEEYVPTIFTGGYDKKENLIYEGDIVKYNGEFAQVIYDEQFMQFRMLVDGLYFSFYNIDGKKRDVEIVGNIFENPHLIKS